MVNNEASIYKAPTVYKQAGGGGNSGGVFIGSQYYATKELNGIVWICSDLLYDDNLTDAGVNPISPTTPAYWNLEGDPCNNHYFYNHAAIEYFIQNNVFPDGWRVPSVADYTTLKDNYTAYEIRSRYGWNAKLGTNETGLNFIGAGFFTESGNPKFYNKGDLNNLWTSDLDNGLFRAMQLSVGIGFITEPTTQRGYSLRLCKDA